jgi:sec-independent protein translocase protein TatC
MRYFAADMLDQPQEEERDKPMPFLAHLEELRWRLVRSAIAIVLGAVVVFIFTKDLVSELYMSMRYSDFPTYKFFCWLGRTLGMEEGLCATRIEIDSLQSIGMSDQFTTHLMFALGGGLVIAFPFISFQMWGFLKPALRDNERKNSTWVIAYTTLLFFLGILFGYFIISPLGVQFFGNYKMVEGTDNNFTITSYMGMITKTTFLTGIFFELPVIIYILARIGLMSAAFLRKYRRHSVVVVLILSAIITPPDFISQIIVALPIMVLYEISILIAARVEKKRKLRNGYE